MPKKRQTTFGVSYKGQPIKEVDTGIESASSTTVHNSIPGLVSDYEVDCVRIDSGYNLIEWKALHYTERAREVAHYRLRHKIEYLENQAQIKKAKAKK